ncbi:glycosyltransferase family 39 protein [Nocardioides ginkgobilobae]
MTTKAAFARPASIAAGLTFLLLVATASRYGYHRDELYFLAAGRHLDWGYPDQPPLVPLLARGLDTGSLTLLRVPSALSAALVVFMAGLMARRLGASTFAEWVASIRTALSGLVLATGHLLSTSTVLILGTTTLTFLVVLLSQGANPRLWLLAGLVGGLTFQGHVLVGFVLLAIALVSRRRRGPVAAGFIALTIGASYLIWQATHGWPQLEVAADIAEGGSATSVSRSLFLVTLVLQLGLWLTPVWVLGLWRSIRDRTLRPLPAAFLLLVALFLVIGGKPYYVGGFLPFLMAAGAQPLVDAVARWVPAALLAASAPAFVFTLPVLPVDSVGPVLAINPDAGETIGWPSFADQVEHVVAPGQVVITANYGQAGALQRYTDLEVFSGHNGYGLWAVPPGSSPAVLVGLDPDFCRASRDLGEIDLRVSNDEDGTALVRCLPERPWAQIWPDLRHPG